MPSIVQIDRAHLEELMYEVKETLATDYATNNSLQKNKQFAAIDLWKIHRSYKSANINFKQNL